MRRVSCVLPTRSSRLRFLPMALECWDRQTYPDRELVIVLNADDPFEMPPLPKGARVVRTVNPVLGAKWNVGYGQADGDYHCPWFDDDWQRPDSLSIRMAAIGEALSVGCASMLFWDIPQAKGYRLTRSQSAPPTWVPFGTLLTHRSLWERHQFPTLNVGEDTAWQVSINRRPVLVADDGFFVAMQHETNGWKPTFRGECWTPLTESLEDLIGPDAERYGR